MTQGKNFLNQLKKANVVFQGISDKTKKRATFGEKKVDANTIPRMGLPYVLEMDTASFSSFFSQKTMKKLKTEL